MTALQIIALIGVAAAGGALALMENPLRQTLVLGVFGLTLVFLFFTFQAPDVALSEIAVGTVALPLIVLAALRKIAEQERTPGTRQQDGE